jgi:alpha-tubulin suppressor-like RCC1 family protein
LHWLSTIEVHEYNEKYPYYFRLLSLVQDFQIRKKEHWNFKDIQCLQQAILKAEINRKEKITIHEFIKKLIDEIEDCSFGLYNNMIQAFIYEANVDLKWLDENISSSVFNCLYMIADKYNDSKSFAEANQNHLKEGISQKEVVTNGIIQSIKNAGVDTEKELQLQDLALEILSCSKLAYTLAEKPINDNNKDEEYKKPNAKLELSSQNNDKVSPIVLENLQLSLMSKAFSASDDFCILIDNNHQVKTFGRNGYGCLGIGSNENKIYEEPVNVIDVPQDIACISVDSGKNHAIALFENGDLYAWGKSDDGQLGDNTKDERLSGFKCMGLPKNRTIVKILASAESSIVLFENGEIYATGKLTNSLVFQPYELNFRVKDFDVMYDSSDIALVLVDSDNKILIKKIGYSSETKWIEHSEDDFYQPLGLHEDAIISKLSAGNCYLHVVTQNNTLYAIGDNSSGQLGTNERSTWATKSFKKVYGINEEIRQIVSGGYCDNSFALVLTESKIYGWGDNESWQLGKQENYRSEYTTSGLIRKETHERKYYLERKPKVIKEFLEVISKNSLVELSCSAERSFICDKKNSKIYKLGYTSDNVEIISY